MVYIIKNNLLFAPPSTFIRYLNFSAMLRCFVNVKITEIS